MLSGYFYLADESIAETEDRGEEEESDERTPPACLVDDDRNDPAGHLHQGAQEMRGGDAVTQV